MNFELSWGDIGILFFLTLGPLKAILPFARVTRGTEPAFQRTVAWRAVAIATAIVLGEAYWGQADGGVVRSVPKSAGARVATTPPSSGQLTLSGARSDVRHGQP